MKGGLSIERGGQVALLYSGGVEELAECAGPLADPLCIGFKPLLVDYPDQH
jgi:hypothetical protein